VVRALAKDPSRRFADAEAMLSALDAVPVQERADAIHLAQARAEEESTTVMAEISARQAALPSRLWSWLRYGQWRWPKRC
jgi:hypothetical protein